MMINTNRNRESCLLINEIFRKEAKHLALARNQFEEHLHKAFFFSEVEKIVIGNINLC